MCSLLLKAQDSTAFFTLTKAEIQANNITNLEEAFKMLPFLHQYKNTRSSVNTSGALAVSTLAILKDDMPLMLDQNIGYDLRAIPTWDLERIEVHTSTVGARLKNSGYLTIKLYTDAKWTQPVTASARLVNSSGNDLHTTFQVGLSNGKHAANFGINRSFNSSLYLPDRERTTATDAILRYDINAQYDFQILRSMKLRLATNNSLLTMRSKGDILAGTSRVRDINTQFNSHNLNGILTTALSRHHTLALSGLINRFTNEVVSWDKDLSSGKSEPYKGKVGAYSTGYDYGYMKLALQSHHLKLNYSLGVELSNTIDNTYSNINAISTEYADYGIFGIFSYQFKNTFKLEGGVKALNNSLTSTTVMPLGKITLAPNKDLQVSACVQKGMAYPLFSQWFYPNSLTGGSTNNVLLSPLDRTSTHLNLLIRNEALVVNSGLIYVREGRIPREGGTMRLQNLGKSASTATYISLLFKEKYWQVQPNVIIHGTNNVRDTTNLTFFEPELNLNASAFLFGSSVKLVLNARFLGKKTISSLSEDTIILNEVGGMSAVNAGLTYSFPNQKLILGLGTTNLLNSTFISENRFALSEIAITPLSTNSVLNNKPRAFYVSIIYNFK
jgi:hypothetical protein